MRIKHWGASGAPNRVICFPYAGGDALSFRSFARCLSDEFEVYAIEPPGHRFSSGEPLTCMEDMITLYRRELSDLFLQPFFLLGHSLGGLVAFALARVLEQEGIYPRSVFLSAALPPHHIESHRFDYEDDELLLSWLLDMGVFPGGTTESRRDIYREYFAVFRADLHAFYQTQLPFEPKLKAPLCVLYSEEDRQVASSYQTDWSYYGSVRQFADVPGGHLFLQSKPNELADKVTHYIKDGDALWR